jgi:hypothetical protein
MARQATDGVRSSTTFAVAADGPRSGRIPLDTTTLERCILWRNVRIRCPLS